MACSKYKSGQFLFLPQVALLLVLTPYHKSYFTSYYKSSLPLITKAIFIRAL